MDFRPVVGAMHRLELMRKIRFRRLLSDRGLHPGQPPLLAYIAEHPGCTQREAADELDITPASAAASLKRLEKAGLVSRVSDPVDARRNCLGVTAEGARRLQQSRQDFDQLDCQMFAGLTPEDLERFKTMCDRMFDNLADESTRGLNICKLHRAANTAIHPNEEET